MLDEFERFSGLKINPKVIHIYMAGRIDQSFCDEVQRLGIPIDSLPVWYMGLPLTKKSMTHDDN